MYGSRPRYVERDTLETYSIDNTREYFFKPYIRVGGDRMDNKNLSRHIRKERLNGSLLFCTIAKHFAKLSCRQCSNSSIVVNNARNVYRVIGE